jgi:hypothetical protein
LTWGSRRLISKPWVALLLCWDRGSGRTKALNALNALKALV